MLRDKQTKDFYSVLDEIKAMHDRKNADYGSEEDSFANIRRTERFGIPAWVGSIIRASDKVSRLEAYVRKGSLENESVEDSLLDLAVYSCIALAMYREGECLACKNGNIHSDRSICACGTMHYYCTEGHQQEGCEYTDNFNY